MQFIEVANRTDSELRKSTKYIVNTGPVIDASQLGKTTKLIGFVDRNCVRSNITMLTYKK